MACFNMDSSGTSAAVANRLFKKQLNKVYAWYTGGFLAFVLVLVPHGRKRR